MYLGLTTSDGIYKAYQYLPTGASELYNFTMSMYGGYSEFHRKNKKFITANDSNIMTYGLKCDNPNMIISN